MRSLAMVGWLGWMLLAVPAVAEDCADWPSERFFASAAVEEVVGCLHAGADADARDEAGRNRKLTARLFGQETLRYFDDSFERMWMFGRETEAELAASGVPREDQLPFLMARVRDNLPKHLAVSVPLAWRGMQPSTSHRSGLTPENAVPSIIPDPWFGIACWLLLIFSLVRGTRRNRRVLLALTFCPAVIVTLNALVSPNYFRYNIGLVTPLSAGVALSIAWAIDGARNGLRRWIPRTMTHDPNRSTDSHGRS